MDVYRQNQLEIGSLGAAIFVPPLAMAETAWDILLALHSEVRNGVGLRRLESLISVSRRTMGHWLSVLEDRGMVTGEKDDSSGELRAVLTLRGRELLGRYLSAVGDLEGDF